MNLARTDMRTRVITITAIIFALALFRILPHLPNVSPVAAMALFGGAYFADKRMGEATLLNLHNNANEHRQRKEKQS